MWNYSEKTKKYFFEPVNAGSLDDANGVGEVGSISCGDALKLFLKVDPATEIISDAKFQTFGCGSAIANFRGEAWEDDDHEEGALICKCFGIDAGMIERAVRVNKLTTIEEVTNYTKAGGSCKTCHEAIEEVLDTVLKAMVAEGVIDTKPAPSCPVAPSAPVHKPMTNLQKIQLITTTIEELRPTLQRDGGDIELVDIDGDTVMVNLHGSCVGCQMSSITLSGVQERLMTALGKPVRVIPAKAA